MPICKLNHVKDAISDGHRLLGLDIGKKTIGLALSDKSLAIASPVKILWRSKFTPDVNSIFEFAMCRFYNTTFPLYKRRSAITKLQKAQERAKQMCCHPLLVKPE